jgi:WD40 repeat protein
MYPVSDSAGGDTRGTTYAARGSLLFVAGRRPDNHYQDFSIYRLGGSGPPRLLSATTIEGTQDRGIAPVAAVRPDGKALAAETGGAGGGVVTLWDTSNPAVPERAAWVEGITGRLVKILDIGFSPDNRTMAVLSYHATTDARYLHLVDVSDVRAPFVTSTVRVGDGVSPVVFSPDGRYLLAPGEDAAAAIRAAGGGIVGQLPASVKITAAAFSASGAVLATGEANGTVKLWDTAEGRAPTLMRTLTRRPDAIHQLAFDPRTGFLGVADAMTVQLWKIG